MKIHYNVGPPFLRTISWGSRKSNVTIIYDTQITTVFMGVINQRSHHWGAPHCTIWRRLADLFSWLAMDVVDSLMTELQSPKAWQEFHSQ